MKKTLCNLILILSLCSVGAFADDAQAPAQHHFHKGLKKVVLACAKAENVTLPAPKGSEGREQVHACVKQFRESFKSCLTTANVPKLGRGVWASLTDAQKASVKSCRQQAFQGISSSNSSS